YVLDNKYIASCAFKTGFRLNATSALIQQDGVTFFNLINELHDRTSLIITVTNPPSNGQKYSKMMSLQQHYYTVVRSLNSAEKAIEWNTEKPFFKLKKINLN